MKTNNYEIDKLTAATVHIEAATLLILREESPEAAHTLLAAARTVLWDLSKTKPNKAVSMLDDAVNRHVVPGKEREWRRYQNRAANFFKHADKDPTDTLRGVKLGALNDMELLILVLVAGQYLRKLTPRMTISLTYSGFKSGDWFDFRGYVESISDNKLDYDHYRNMGEDERLKLCLQAYDILPATRPTIS